MTTYKEQAQYVLGWLQQQTRDDGTKFYSFKDGAPEWVHLMAQEAHGDTFPNDEYYDAIVRVLEQLAEYDPDTLEKAEDALREMRVDSYNTELAKWFASRPIDFAEYVNEATASGYLEIFPALMAAQASWYYAVGDPIIRALTAQLEAPE